MNASRSHFIVWVGLGLGLFVAGCTSSPPSNNSTRGTIAGTVTNSLTEAPIAGATVTLVPEVSGVTITSDSSGEFSAQLPLGVYSLTIAANHFESQMLPASVTASEVFPVEIALIPSAPVALEISVEGDAAPGAQVALTLATTPLDGSTVQSTTWSQKEGASVTVSGGQSAEATITLPAETLFKSQLIHVLREPPITANELPPNVPLPEGEFPGGLPNRFHVVGLNPFALEKAAAVAMTATVVTSSGTYTKDAEIHTALPWKAAGGIRNVPLGVPVLLHGRDHIDEDGDGRNDETDVVVGQYGWALAGPPGSTARLVEPTSQDPYFIPDVSGKYTVVIIDTTRAPGNENVVIEIYAGPWQGVITGQDSEGLPLAADCTVCHNGNIAPDNFTPWRQTGHAAIFKDNINTSTHYGEDCFSCHSVGYDRDVNNGGFDDADDFEDFLAAGLLNNPGDNWTTVINDFPQTAHLANVQCESCHGPQDSTAHTTGWSRVTLASDSCAVCHGEPLRHARFQQWQLSAHANYELATDEGTDGSCARCHTANGFLAWLPILLDDDPNTDPLANVEVTWTADESHPQTCVTCHDPHSNGSTTGVDTDATVRISGDTPPLIAGFQVFGAGKGAICMTCHNTRRGLRNDDNFDMHYQTPDASRSPHGSAQTDVLVGENAYFAAVGVRGAHSLVEDTCVNCHMNRTEPPDLLAYQKGGTNHTFYASPDICVKCHGEAFNSQGVQSAYEASSAQLKLLVENAYLSLITRVISDGNTISLGDQGTITDVAAIEDIELGEGSGRVSLAFTFTDETTIGPLGVNNIKVIDGSGTDIGEILNFADPRLVKAGWNWNLGQNDGSRGVHNPTFVFTFIDLAIDALNDLAQEEAEG